MRRTSMSVRLPQATINALAHSGSGTTASPEERINARPQPGAR
jgi:hypothetical protein